MSTLHEQQVKNWWTEGDTPVHTASSLVTYLVYTHSTFRTICRHFLMARQYIYRAAWRMTPLIELVHGTDQRAQDNLRRFHVKQPLVGYLLPYVTSEEAKQQGWPFHEEHGWVEVP